MTSYTHKPSPTGLPKRELNKKATNEHAKLDGEKPVRSQCYAKSMSKPGKWRIRGGLPQGRVHQFPVQWLSALKTDVQVT